MRPPGSVYLAALLIKFVTTCPDVCRVALDPKRLGGTSDELVPVRIGFDGQRCLHGVVNDRFEIDRIPAKLDPSASCDARDIKKIFEQSRHGERRRATSSDSSIIADCPHLQPDDLQGIREVAPEGFVARARSSPGTHLCADWPCSFRAWSSSSISIPVFDRLYQRRGKWHP